MINLEEIEKIYFIGIGGVGMSAVAGIARERGFEVSGSDSKEVYDPAKSVLDYAKIDYHIGYKAEQPQNAKADVYIISAGEDLNNPEVKYVYDNNLNHCSFAQLLYELAKEDLRIVITGTNGKSTTTGMMGYVLKNLDDSSFFTGAILKNYESNFHHGQGHYFVMEGDEYKSEWDDPTPKFHYYKPDILVLTNLEFDHPDIFGSFEDYKIEFERLIEEMPADGLIIYNADDPELAKMVHKSNVSSASFGIDNPADYKAENLDFGKQYTTINVSNKFSKNISSALLGATEEYKIQLPGKINVYNSLAVIATLRALGFSHEDIALELLSYQGIKRRFEIVSQKNNITVVDDYAHHPSAVKQTLEAARLKYKDSKIWAIFEPHTFSRTKATLPDLAQSFDSADEVIISKIYPAREKVKEGNISSEEVIKEIKSNIKNPSAQVRLVNTQDEALGILKSELKPGDVVIVMAVGDFNKLAYNL